MGAYQDELDLFFYEFAIRMPARHSGSPLIPLCADPGPPQGVVATVMPNLTTVRLSWNLVPDAMSYWIYRRLGSDCPVSDPSCAWEFIGLSQGFLNAFDDPNRDPCSVYSYYVEGRLVDGCTNSPSTVVTVPKIGGSYCQL